MASHTSHRALSIFIVEDALPVRQAMRAAFECIAGARVIGEAEDAKRATRLIRELRPDVVTLDVRLKDGYGIDVLRAIEAGREGPQPLVMVLTNHVDAHVRDACFELGAAHFFDKATEFPLACDVIAQAAAGRLHHERRHGS